MEHITPSTNWSKVYSQHNILCTPLARRGNYLYLLYTKNTMWLENEFIFYSNKCLVFSTCLILASSSCHTEVKHVTFCTCFSQMSSFSTCLIDVQLQYLPHRCIALGSHVSLDFSACLRYLTFSEVSQASKMPSFQRGFTSI